MMLLVAREGGDGGRIVGGGHALADNWHEVAAPHANFGERSEALQTLARAVEHGWADRHQLLADHHFALRRFDRELQQLVQRARAAITLPDPTGRDAS